MPHFSNQPPDDPRGPALPLRRTPANRPLVAIVTCDDLVGTPTHYWGGRTVPCETEHCEPCLAGVPWRWHGYVSAYSIPLKLHFLFEVTARCAEALVQYRKANGTLRGCIFEAKRMNNSPNGRVFLQTKTADLEKYPLPNPPDLTKVLAIIWNLAAPSVKQEGTTKQRPRVKVNSKGNGQQWQPETTPDETRSVLTSR